MLGPTEAGVGAVRPATLESAYGADRDLWLEEAQFSETLFDRSGWSIGSTESAVTFDSTAIDLIAIGLIAIGQSALEKTALDLSSATRSGNSLAGDDSKEPKVDPIQRDQRRNTPKRPGGCRMSSGRLRPAEPAHLLSGILNH